jgi:hypothetical protein
MGTDGGDGMTNLGILSGTISDNKAIILDEDAKGSNAPYLYGSVYNAGTSAVTLKVNLNTKGGANAANIPLIAGQGIEFKSLQIHSIQCLNTSPNLNYVFSVAEIEGELVGETRY